MKEHIATILFWAVSLLGKKVSWWAVFYVLAAILGAVYNVLMMPEQKRQDLSFKAKCLEVIRAIPMGLICAGLVYIFDLERTWGFIVAFVGAKFSDLLWYWTRQNLTAFLNYLVKFLRK